MRWAVWARRYGTTELVCVAVLDDLDRAEAVAGLIGGFTVSHAEEIASLAGGS